MFLNRAATKAALKGGPGAHRFALRPNAISKLGRRHETVMSCHPVGSGELDVWEDEQVWEEITDGRVRGSGPKHH
jgi:hypothetical protein